MVKITNLTKSNSKNKEKYGRNIRVFAEVFFENYLVYSLKITLFTGLRFYLFSTSRVEFVKTICTAQDHLRYPPSFYA